MKKIINKKQLINVFSTSAKATPRPLEKLASSAFANRPYGRRNYR